MFSYPARLRMHHVDATGAIYFPRYFELATECLEAFLDRNRWLQVNGEFIIPVVHAECDCNVPLRWGMAFSMQLGLVSRGTTSFTVKSLFITDTGETAATVQVTHVAVDKASGRPVPIPESLALCLDSIAMC